MYGFAQRRTVCIASAASLSGIAAGPANSGRCPTGRRDSFLSLREESRAAGSDIK